VRRIGIGVTDVGRRRASNEDAFFVDDALGLYAVADGMGGHNAGEVASQEAIDTLHGMVKRGADLLDPLEHIDDSGEAVRRAVRLLESAVQAGTPPEAAVPAEAPPPEPSLAPFVPLEPFAPEPRSRPSRAWAFGVAFLVLVLALQATYAFRARLAQQYPVVRPVLESVCAAAGCTVPWVNDEAALKLEDSELLEVPGKPGQIALQARIRNLSPSAQEFPHLELTLTDLTGQTAVRRVLRPSDYLGRAPVPGEVMASGSEALLSVRLETGRIRPTGYELLLFYP